MDREPQNRQLEETGRGRRAESPHQMPKTGWRDILIRTKNEISEDNLSIVAAGVAFFFLLGLFPGLGAAVSIYGLVADPVTLQQQLSSATVLPADARQLLMDQFHRIAGSSRMAGWGAVFGLLLALWSCSKGMKATMAALNIVYEEEEKRGFLKLNGIALLLTVVTLFLGLLAVGIIVAVPAAVGHLGLTGSTQMLVRIIRWPVLFVLFLTAVGLVYRFGPSRDAAKWKWLSPGAILAVVLWLLGSILFSIYVSRFGNYNKTYGSLGAVIILLMWFYLTAFTILLGAELNSEAEHQTSRDTTKGEPRPRGSRGAYVADHLAKSPE